MKGRRFVALVLLALLNISTSACNGGEENGGACVAPPPAQKLSASCEVTLESPPIQANADRHDPERTPLTYCSNPPSSGPHYGIWADFQEYANPVEAPYLVHSLEHGGIVLFYKCDPPGCPDVVEQLREARKRVSDDPKCSASTRVRIIIAPNPSIPTRVAAAAWGATYQAACVDAPTLDTFLRDHYAKGPENLCEPGRTF